MGRAHPIAAVYMLRNILNGMMYIGESSNIIDRQSSYRTFARNRTNVNQHSPIFDAIREYGLDSFEFIILASSNEDPKLVDNVYRRQVETRYIRRYNTTNPSIGYNLLIENHVRGRRGGKGHKHTKYTKMLKSNPILAYNTEDDSVMLYMSSVSFCKMTGCTDRSIIIRAMRHAHAWHGYYFYNLSYGKRLDNAINTLKKPHTRESIERYLKGLYAVNEWCIEFGFDVIDIDTIQV